MQITVCDKMQDGYTYTLSAQEGDVFHDGFAPELSPKEMLALGVFEGKYLNDCKEEFPTDWFEDARLAEGKADILLNCFEIKSRQSLSVWQKNGWILEPDPRGWFQWYCRYYRGRRIPDLDRIQIGRWRSFRRHKAQIEQNCLPYAFMCRKKQRQALLQWAYNPFF